VLIRFSCRHLLVLIQAGKQTSNEESKNGYTRALLSACKRRLLLIGSNDVSAKAKVTRGKYLVHAVGQHLHRKRAATITVRNSLHRAGGRPNTTPVGNSGTQ